MSLHDQLGLPESGHARGRRGALIAGATAVLLILVGISALVAQRTGKDDGDADSPPVRPVGAWADAGVPYQDREGYHFQGQATKHDATRDPEAVAFTADAAVFLHDPHSYPDPDNDDDNGGEGNPSIGTLSALFSDGDFEVIGKDVLGVPFADPGSHLVMWMTWTSVDSAEITAYNTEDRKVVATHELAWDSESLWGVEDGTAYLSGKEGPRTWTPESESETLPLPGLDGFEGVVMDATAERLVTFGFQSEDTAIRDSSGKVLKEIRGWWFSTFSPDGAHLVLNTGQEHRVLDSKTFEEVPLDLPEAKANSVARWGSTGTLVVTRTPLESDEIEEPWYLQTHFACTLPAGTCRKLPGDAMLPLNEASALGQFSLLVAVAFS